MVGLPKSGQNAKREYNNGKYHFSNEALSRLKRLGELVSKIYQRHKKTGINIFSENEREPYEKSTSRTTPSQGNP